MAGQSWRTATVCKGELGMMTNRSDRRLPKPVYVMRIKRAAVILGSNLQISSRPGTIMFRQQAVHMTAPERSQHPNPLAIRVPSTHDKWGHGALRRGNLKSSGAKRGGWPP